MAKDLSVSSPEEAEEAGPLGADGLTIQKQQLGSGTRAEEGVHSVDSRREPRPSLLWRGPHRQAANEEQLHVRFA
ncbi:hypothetical protein GN956_G941 [Arapaima gigas]